MAKTSGGKPQKGRSSQSKARHGSKNQGKSGSKNKGRSSSKSSAKKYQGKTQGKSKTSSHSRQGGTGGGKQTQKKGSGRKSQYTATTRSVEADRRANAAKRRRDLKGAAVNLPNWVIESVERTTPRDRIAPTLEALGAASEALADGRFQSAVKHGERAKALSPNDATIRETIGIAAYRLGDWPTALSELRAYRRMAGESTHLPIEMDVLRALGRNADVEKAWKELQRRGGHGLVMNEGIVVYASYLIDEGRPKEAWKIANPGRTVAEPNEAHLRLYFVAARAAAAAGDAETARQLADAIVLADPSFPGWEQLSAEIAAVGS